MTLPKPPKDDEVNVISPNNTIHLDTAGVVIPAGVKTAIPRTLLEAAKAEGAVEVKE